MAPTDYSKRKNAELEELLKARGLPTGGKKAELVARLQASDAEGGGDAGAAARASTTTKEAGGEDEIDWDDDAAAGGAAATTASAAAAVAAGGQGQPPNPVAVPNQVPAQDPSKTSDLTVVKGSDEAATASEAVPVTTTTATTGSDAAAAPAPADPAPAAPKEDFSSHIPPSSLTAELEKRKARAARFGLPATTAEETTKALERAKRFGLDKEPATESTGTETEAKADTTPSIVAGLDRALPERQQRKRGRGAAGGVEGGGPVEMGGDRGGKRRDSRQRRGGDAHQKTDKSNGNGSGSGKAKSGPGTGAGVGAKKEISEKDRLAAEARKKRFAAAAAT